MRKSGSNTAPNIPSFGISKKFIEIFNAAPAIDFNATKYFKSFTLNQVLVAYPREIVNPMGNKKSTNCDEYMNLDRILT